MIVVSRQICFFFSLARLWLVCTQQEVVRRAQEMIEDGALKEKAGQQQPSAAGDVDTKEKKAPQVRWNLGDLEFEAYMRMMDNAVSSQQTDFSFIASTTYLTNNT